MKHGNDHRFCETNIGVSALQNTRKKFNVLATSMAEISVIITTKPLVSVSTDAATPLILTPGNITHNEDTICDVARNLKEFTDKEFYNTK